MKCDCEKAKLAYLTLNRLNQATDIAVMCLKCDKLWYSVELKK